MLLAATVVFPVVADNLNCGGYNILNGAYFTAFKIAISHQCELAAVNINNSVQYVLVVVYNGKHDII